MKSTTTTSNPSEQPDPQPNGNAVAPSTVKICPYEDIAGNSDSSSDGDNDDSDRGSEDMHCDKRARIEPSFAVDYIPPFPPGKVSAKYIVVKGTQPGIYDDWCTLIPTHSPFYKC
jgi:hypothetical protein